MIEEIQPNLFRVEVPLPNSPLKFLNSYVIRSSERNLIVDTGLNRKECLEVMQSRLKQLDIDLAKTDFFITHLHADHFGLVSKLATGTSRVFFNRPETELIEASGWWERMVAYAAKNGFPENEVHEAIKSHPGREFGSEWHHGAIGDGDAGVVLNSGVILQSDLLYDVVFHAEVNGLDGLVPGHAPNSVNVRCRAIEVQVVGDG